MNIRLMIAAILIAATAPHAHSATLEVTYVNNTPANQDTVYGDATRFTVRFANSIDNDTQFTFADFFSRSWHSIERLAQGSSLQSLFGAYPTANVENTGFSSTGWVMGSDGNIQGNQIDFKETSDNGSGFLTINIDPYSLSSNFSVWALWDGVPNGGVFRFIQESVSYDAFGTAADFEDSVSAVPLPAGAVLLASGLLGLGLAARKKRRPAL